MSGDWYISKASWYEQLNWKFSLSESQNWKRSEYTMHSICAKIGNADDRDDDREPTNANEAIDKGLPPTNEEDVKMEQ